MEVFLRNTVGTAVHSLSPNRIRARFHGLLDVRSKLRHVRLRIASTGALLLAGALFGFALPAGAEESLKQAIFDECGVAKEKFDEIKAEEEGDVFAYLVRVLGLSTEVPDIPAAFVVDPSGKDPGPGVPAIWQSVDAKRELNAKRCALELLEKAGARAFPSLPDLAALSTSQNLSDEIGVGLEEVAADIAEKAHNAGLALPETYVKSLIEQLGGMHPLAARNIAVEFYEQVLPHLLRALSTISEEQRAQVSAVMKEADPAGETTLGAVLTVSRESSDILPRALASLSYVPSTTVLKLGAEIAETVGRIDKSAARPLARLLGKACLSAEPSDFPSSAVAAIEKSPLYFSKDFISLEAQRCLLKKIPGAAGVVVQAARTGTGEEQNFALELIPHLSVRDLPASMRAPLYLDLTKLAQGEDSRKSSLALIALPALKEERSKSLTLIAKIAREMEAKKAPLDRDRAEAIVQALTGLDAKRDVDRVAGFLFLMLKEGIRVDEVVLMLGGGGPAVEKELVKLLKSSSQTDQEHALRALSGRSLVSKEGVRAMAERLSDSALCDSVQRALTNREKSAFSALRALLPKLTGRCRGTALVLMSRGGSLNKTERSELDAFLAAPLARGASDAGNASERPMAAESAVVATLRVVRETREDRVSLMRALEELKEPVTESGDELKGLLKEIIAASENDDEVRYKALLVLARMGEPDYDWPGFVSDTIDSAAKDEEWSRRLPVLFALSPEIVLGELTEAYRSESPAKLIGAARVGGRLTNHAASLIPNLWPLRQHGAPSVRAAVTVALLELNPLLPELKEPVRRLLVNRYYDQARRSAVSWRGTVAVSELDRKAFGALRRARLEGLMWQSP